MRTESDFIGQREIPKDALWGIHSLRAKENFPDQTTFHKEWFMAIGIVKQACYQTYSSFLKAIQDKFPNEEFPFQLIESNLIEELEKVSIEINAGKHFEHFIIPAIQGGAGTSINMNVNEIISNRALQNIGKPAGSYHDIDPFEHANVFQSTNDVIPTSLKVTCIRLLQELEESINTLRMEVEKTESKYRNVLRQAYTQMQAAVPSSYDKLFSTYNNALSRDWWRISKCFERIKEVNLGGGAIGTGLSIPRFFIMEVVPNLQKLTGLPITRSENLSDATANQDSFVEVHATLKAHAVNLEKMVSDLRLLGSDLFVNREVYLPQKQVGSSIMPGKINPVIPEFVISVAHKVYANDLMISNLSGQGCLELNAYLPSIGHALIDSIKLLIAANNSLIRNLFRELEIKTNPLEESILKNPSVATALSPYIGYHQASNLAKEMKTNQISIREANAKLNLVTAELLNKLIQPEELLKMGFRIGETLNR
ncbi:aspartate ammonia-lyase [Labilibaculum sp. A4]|uniref:lyase family protein n=1 Tax=Labilibaculum euxinus TaxID=2686357 RepID=UPI000F621175|nr:lyase family protein [Labilibaculum euxinus]MDQ1769772.1 lyase family protein [Labilibaculum euxinus]MWN76330.1 aspartate ammonia-lyase [Labilibaculum euxinus]